MNGYGLVQVATPDEVTASEAKAELQESKEAAAKDAFAADLQARWQGYREARRSEIEQEWLAALRAVKGEYSPEQQAIIKENESLSDIYIKITATKVNTAYARLVDMLFQNADSFWDVVPQPIAELPKAVRQHLRMKATQELLRFPVSPEDRNGLINERFEELKQHVTNDAMESASRSALAMKKQIKEYLINADGLNHLKLATREMVTLGTGVLKVATLAIRTHEKWESEGEQFALKQKQSVEPEIKSVSCFDTFPDPYSSDCAHPNDVFIRHVLTQHQMKELAETPGFDAQVIEEILYQAPEGNHEPLDYERELRHINDANEPMVTSRRYDVLEYWGPVNGEKLKQYGIEGVENNAEYQANIWTCNSRVIMARLNPLKPESIPYKFIPYEKVLHRFWGVGIAKMMDDSQDVINATGRALLDNAALTSGIMLQLDAAKLPDGVSLEEAKKIHPNKVWVYDSTQSDGPMINAITLQSNQNELMGIFELFRRFVDEETSLPSYTHGEQTQNLNKTASGMSMLMTAANVSMKSVVKNIDEYGIRPLIESLYHFAMRWSEIDAAKRGDLDILPMGSSALVAKELHSQRMLQAMQVADHPVYGPLTEPRYLLSEYYKSLDIDNDKALVPEEKLNAAPVNPVGSPINPEAMPGQELPGNSGVSVAPPRVTHQQTPFVPGLS